MNSDVRRRLKALADDLEGPLGRIPFDRALRRHIDLFEKLQREGCSWSQLARALAAIGVRRADGGTISADQVRRGVLSSACWPVGADAATFICQPPPQRKRRLPDPGTVKQPHPGTGKRLP
jgi:hypothetical protein